MKHIGIFQTAEAIQSALNDGSLLNPYLALYGVDKTVDIDSKIISLPTFENGNIWKMFAICDILNSGREPEFFMTEQYRKNPYRSAMPLVREMPASERPREKMLAQGAAALSNTELLAVLMLLRCFGESQINQGIPPLRSG